MTMRIVIMGVSGSGKSSVGAALSDRLGIHYLDGDDLHSPDSVAKMAAGIPLTDADRWPWLDRVAQALACDTPLIIGCSALRRAYRDRIRAGAGGPVQFVHLAGRRAVIASRMAARIGHYMPPGLLDSQLATLEPPGPDEALTVSIEQPLADLIETIAKTVVGGTI